MRALIVLDPGDFSGSEYALWSQDNQQSIARQLNRNVRVTSPLQDIATHLV